MSKHFTNLVAIILVVAALAGCAGKPEARLKKAGELANQGQHAAAVEIYLKYKTRKATTH